MSLESKVERIPVSEVFGKDANLKDILEDLFEGEDFLPSTHQQAIYLSNIYKSECGLEISPRAIEQNYFSTGRSKTVPQNFLLLLKQLMEEKKPGWTLKIPDELLPKRVNATYISKLISDIKDTIGEKYNRRFKSEADCERYLAKILLTEIKISPQRIRLYRMSCTNKTSSATAPSSVYLQLKEFKSALERGEVELPKEYFNIRDLFWGYTSLKDILDDLFDGEDLLNSKTAKLTFLTNKYKSVYGAELPPTTITSYLRGGTHRIRPEFLTLLKQLMEEKKPGWTLKIPDELLPDNVNARCVTELVTGIQEVLEEKYNVEFRSGAACDEYLAKMLSTEIEISETRMKYYRRGGVAKQRAVYTNTVIYTQLRDFKSALEKGKVVLKTLPPKKPKKNLPIREGGIPYDPDGLYKLGDKIDHPALGTVTAEEIKYEGRRGLMTVKSRKGEVTLACGVPKYKPA